MDKNEEKKLVFNLNTCVFYLNAFGKCSFFLHDVVIILLYVDGG